MSGRLAGLLLLGACVVLAALLLGGVIAPPVGGITFAVALAVLGALSGGFRRKGARR